ncbi:thiosulfate dehydrogenase [quinone] large subunit [Rhodococcus triatomae]|uniref:Thiosulfate dehydrogenase [quinone] large subunit n=1 Tax=Rhodococcus triatomae TaxID=300028 RepID=A0A1G8LX77_9NOCA|nr:thiosulfate dehydrogenase [quinone] large subunit [Rhodococcus triatomae]
MRKVPPVTDTREESVVRPAAADARAVHDGSARWKVLALFRIALGFIFFWPFLDKTFGLGYSTVSERAWINGGKPTQGFLTGGVSGPFQGFFESIASPVTDILFMAGLFGIGLAAILGIGLRVAAVSGALLMGLMYLAQWPLESGSSNPIVDSHVIYGLGVVLLALFAAGNTWGLGKLWADLPFVQSNSWLK